MTGGGLVTQNGIGCHEADEKLWQFWNKRDLVLHLIY